jgi:5-methylcytosine-specific restriction endonuclease McrA
MARRKADAGRLWNRVEGAERDVLRATGLVGDEPRGRRGQSSPQRRHALIAALKSLAWTTMTEGDGVRSEAPKIKAGLVAVRGGRCEACGLTVTGLLHLHHVVPVSRGGKNHRWNLALLCPNCHARAHQIDRAAPEAQRPSNARELLARLAEDGTT